MQKFTAGQYINQGYYKSFQPSYINRQFHIDDMEILNLLSIADIEVGRLDMFSKYIPTIDLYMNMHVLKEATRSSKIEGTQTNIDEAILNKEDLPANKRDDWEEVQNYMIAMEWAINELNTLPFSSRLIRDTHKILLQGVRGENKLPGEFRKSQNWIGGVTLNDAIFIPPAHTSVPDLMSDFEKFLHNEEIRFPELLKIGLAHYQFETIHPFLDGNGRTGRLLIPLYLVSKGVLQKPVLYLSSFFEENRRLYYDNLMMVREKNDLTQWFRFFLTGIIETAKNGINTFDKILQLQKKVETSLMGLGTRTTNAKKVVDYLFKRPAINVMKAGEITGLSLPSSYSLISELEKLKILKEITGGLRDRRFVFEEYLNLFR
jgi:Fic family protein